MFRGGRAATDGGSDEQSSAGLGLLAAPSPGHNERVDSYVESAASIETTEVRPAASIALDAVPSQRPSHRQWMRSYQVALVLIDLTAASVAGATALLIRLGSPNNAADSALYATVGALLPLAWVVTVAFNRAYEGRYVGVGPAEFERVFRAFLHMIALVAIASYATKAEIARGFVLVALPLALLLDLAGRYAARKWLHRQRSRGRAMTSVLAVGEPAAVAAFGDLVERDQYAGLRVVGACLPVGVACDDGSARLLAERSVPIYGDIDSVLDSVRASSADTVAVVSSAGVSPEKLRWISWQLEGSNTSLVVSPGLTEVAGPRLHIRPVAGLPLLHVEQPEFRGFRRFLKGALDRTVAIIGLLALSPLLAALWLVVRLTSPGPALFRQTRIGRDGKPFTIFKLRSMYADAEARLADLLEQNANSDGLLFKVHDDPRVTPIGRTLRRFSLDELPQLINLVTGSMSLVGPRPPLPSEVAQYGEDVRRRLLVKPGITGLWQVSGRSDLSWEESVRLDLRYVENWSPTLDLMILWKTARAVIGSAGAY